MSALKNGVLLRNRNEKAIIFKSCMVDNLFFKSLYKYYKIGIVILESILSK